MKKQKTVKKSTTYLIEGALIAAMYAALTLFLMPFSFGEVQLRVSEGLCVLSLFTPAAIPGLTIGCVIANLFSPFGIWDVIFGSIATFLSAILIYYTKKITIKNYPFLFLVIPAIFNGLIVGAEICILSGANISFFITAIYVAIGEIAAMCSAGNIIYFAYKKIINKKNN